MTELQTLLADCKAHDIRLHLGEGDNIDVDAPPNTLTPALLASLKARKSELLATLRPEADAKCVDLADATELWQAALDRLEGNPLFPREIIEGARMAEASWGDSETLEPIELDPCPACGTLELWQSVAGNWRCQRCDPPETSRHLKDTLAWLKAAQNSPG